MTLFTPEILHLVGMARDRLAVATFRDNLRRHAAVTADRVVNPQGVPERTLALARAALEVPTAGIDFLRLLVDREGRGLYLDPDQAVRDGPIEKRSQVGEAHARLLLAPLQDPSAEEIVLAWNAILDASAHGLVAETSHYGGSRDAVYRAAGGEFVSLPDQTFIPTAIGRASYGARTHPPAQPLHPSPGSQTYGPRRRRRVGVRDAHVPAVGRAGPAPRHPLGRPGPAASGARGAGAAVSVPCGSRRTMYQAIQPRPLRHGRA